MKRALDNHNYDDLPTKRQKLNARICVTNGCDRPAHNELNTCCKSCDKYQCHRDSCTDRLYDYKVKNNQIVPIEDWYDFNKRIKSKFNTDIGSKMKQQLPKYLTNGIKTTIMDFITPQASIKPTWYPQINSKNILIKSSKYGGKP
eukprot:39323_1